MRAVPALAAFALGGLAWLVVAVAKGAWLEVSICAPIAAGLAVAWWGARSASSGLVAAGLGVALLGNAWVLGAYGVGANLPTLLAVVTVAGFAVAVLGVARDVAPAVRWGLGAVALAALHPVLSADVVAPGEWTIGNVLIFAGAAWTAWAWSTPPAATPTAGAA